MIDLLNSAFAFYQNALDLRAQRQQVLASNIANSDTPNYKARDFDFRAALDQAMGSATTPDGGLALKTTAPGHLAGAENTAPAGGPEMAYRKAGQPSLDGNTVDMNVERVEFLENSIHYRANLQILGARIKGLRAAMQPER